MERPLPAALIRDQKPDACTLFSLRDEWIVNDEAGPRRLIGNSFQPLLSPAEKRFTEMVGIGTHRRWVFRAPGGDTLVIDPLIADPTPRLPVWTIVAKKGIAGWDAADFPAVSRSDQTGNWELQADAWKPLPPPGEVDHPATAGNAACDGLREGEAAADDAGWNCIFRRQSIAHCCEKHRRANRLALAGDSRWICRSDVDSDCRWFAVPVQRSGSIAAHPPHANRR